MAFDTKQILDKLTTPIEFFYLFSTAEILYFFSGKNCKDRFFLSLFFGSLPQRSVHKILSSQNTIINLGVFRKREREKKMEGEIEREMIRERTKERRYYERERNIEIYILTERQMNE